MKAISILLLILGGIGILISMNMFGDIGIAGMIGSLAALLGGIGMLLAANKLQALSSK
jgi:hypothetical protein